MLLRSLLNGSVRRELQFTLLQEPTYAGLSLPQKSKADLIADIERHAHANANAHADLCRSLLRGKPKHYIDELIRSSGRRFRATTKAASIDEFIRADADAQNEHDGRRNVDAAVLVPYDEAPDAAVLVPYDEAPARGHVFRKLSKKWMRAANKYADRKR